MGDNQCHWRPVTHPQTLLTRQQKYKREAPRFFFFKIFFRLIYFKDSKSMSGAGGRAQGEKERERLRARISSRLRAQPWSLTQGSIL